MTATIGFGGDPVNQFFKCSDLGDPCDVGRRVAQGSIQNSARAVSAERGHGRSSLFVPCVLGFLRCLPRDASLHLFPTSSPPSLSSRPREVATR
ncbi:hypothetical protein GUJ93_ZPchr0005g14740 [Zizania palustris]|uniref:Uncharacterized protein n=1 Tax=Zizania palustris TaxID=103762 RepID=A0A8J5SXR0_ZIZPA|nr:hypothetical protein GUJ93_ZPchr0005g14740 [Zizania palustris]